MIQLPILTWKNVLFEPGSERVEENMVDSCGDSYSCDVCITIILMTLVYLFFR